MARKSTGTVPPYISLKECIDLASTIYERGAGTMTLDDLATLMGTSIKSSGFRMKMVAMRAFGLLLTDGRSARLSPLGKAIVAPTSREERQESIFQSFNSIPIFGLLHEKFQGGFLPEDTFLANIIEKEYSSPSEYKEKWLKCFKESGKAAGILRDDNGKVRVLQTPSLTGSYMPEQRRVSSEQQEQREEHEQRKQDSDYRHGTAGSFPVVLDEKRSVIVPLDFSRNDLEYLQGVLELYVKRRETKSA